jgi:hypothetical protein
VSNFDFIVGGLMATAKPAGEEGRRRETIKRAWTPTKTKQGWIWLTKYFYVEEYQLVNPHGFLGAKEYGWRWVESHK